MAHPNEDLLRRGYDAFGTGDMETLAALLADDIVWHFPGNNPLAGDYKGRNEVLAFFVKSVEMTGGTLKIELHDVLANDEHGVGLIRVTGQRDGKSLTDNAAQVFHVRDGKASEVWSHAGDQAAIDKFWS